MSWDALAVSRATSNIPWAIVFFVAYLLPAAEANQHVRAPGIVTLERRGQVALVAQQAPVAYQVADTIGAAQGFVVLAEKHRGPDVEVVVVYYRDHIELVRAAQVDVLRVDRGGATVGLGSLLPVPAEAVDVAGHVHQVSALRAEVP